MPLPTDYDERKAIPLASVLDYFPDALRAVAAHPTLSTIPDEFLYAFMVRGEGVWSTVLAGNALSVLLLEVDPDVVYEPSSFATFVHTYAPALAEVARVIAAGQRQHGTTGWDRAKSTDEANTLIRHFLERGTIDVDGVRHSAKMAWRALALLQKEIEAARGDGKISRGSYDSSKVAA